MVALTQPRDLLKGQLFQEIIDITRLDPKQVTSAFVVDGERRDAAFVLVTVRYEPSFVLSNARIQQRNFGIAVLHPLKLMECFKSEAKCSLGITYRDVVKSGHLLVDPFQDANYIRNSATFDTPWEKHNRPHYYG